MAADVEDWFCCELGKFGIDVTEDIARYILSMKDGELEEYMQDLVDTTDPKVRVFLQELHVRCGRLSDSSNNIGKAYRKDTSNDQNVRSSRWTKQDDLKNHDEKKSKKKFDAPPIQNSVQNHVSSKNTHASLTNEEIGVGAKRKAKFVPLFSKEGQAKSVIQLPGRHICECQAAKHKLINNCVSCGRIVCEQEGAGPCVFCGTLVCTPEDQELIDRGSKKGEKLRQYLMKAGGSQQNGASDVSSLSTSKSQQGFDQALQHRDKLLEFDKNSVRRTQVIDDECDYYATDSNQWLGKEDREKLRTREEQLRNARHGSRRDRKITFDFAGRRIIDAEDFSAKTMYSREDDIIQEVHYGKSAEKNVMDIVNPSILLQPPEYVEPASWGPHRSQVEHKSKSSFNNKQPTTRRIQDKELQEISDDGMCLSMHQPWASLLVTGIKIHEGRSWYTSHRGRLWIASTAQTPSPEDIKEHERIYTYLHNGESLSFPDSYPVGCLLGCVNVDDCLSQEDYREKFPNGESTSPYVFICSNPHQLVIRFPIKGKHKIYKLEPHIHQAAKKGLR